LIALYAYAPPSFSHIPIGISPLCNSAMFKKLTSYEKELSERTCVNFGEFQTIVTLKVNFL